MKIGIFSPYWQIMGGGEKYLLDIAQYLSRKDEIYILSNENIKEKANKFFNIKLDRIHFLPEEIIQTKNMLKRLTGLRQFDILFYMTDGSVFFPFSRKNFLILQSPNHIPPSTFFNRLKLLNWKTVCYSQFIQRIIEKRLNLVPITLPPAIDVDLFKCDTTSKKNIILSVGRFFSHLHNKRHDFLVDVFTKNYKGVFNGWKLIIAGGLTDREGEKIVDNLKKQSQGYPVEILANIPFEKLKSLYQEAKIYWHAAGFAEDIEAHPEKAEHFGITTLEAMAAGTVPLVFNAGGVKDIVSDGKNGYLWGTEEEFMEKNRKLLQDGKLLRKLSESSRLRAEDFSQNKFYEKVEEIVTK
ncbi:glycosyltransferase family 4 protein [Candidatus Gottesmanbacteria bacterium]|nr:glycosyltransferase family 4 protein [Candidatus Gottesmanbacteria bacterium]